MANIRDNFSNTTIRTLAMRVGYLCSNPNCRCHTVGPNENPETQTIIGVAAHITAAAENGPRYSHELDADQRKHISNGIWLCHNCSDLIDKNPDQYTVDILVKWKADAEDQMLTNIQGKRQINKNGQSPIPYIEPELIFSFGKRLNKGYSLKNPIEEIDGEKVMVIKHDVVPIIFWDITRYFQLVLNNNSMQDAYNVEVEIIDKNPFSTFGSLKKINALPALKNLEIETSLSDYIEGTYMEGDKFLKERPPVKVEGLTLKISYKDSFRNSYEFIAKMKNGNFELTRVS